MTVLSMVEYKKKNKVYTNKEIKENRKQNLRAKKENEKAIT